MAELEPLPDNAEDARARARAEEEALRQERLVPIAIIRGADAGLRALTSFVHSNALIIVSLSTTFRVAAVIQQIRDSVLCSRELFFLDMFPLEVFRCFS